MNKKIKSLLMTILLGGIYYYFALPPINITSFAFWIFIVILLSIYFIIYFSFKTVDIIRVNIFRIGSRTSERSKEMYIIPVIVFAVFLMIVITNVLMSPLFISRTYSKRIVINESNSFIDDVKEVDLKALPIIDKASSIKLGDRVMGQMPELVSQFDVSNLYTQINYKNDIIRVTPLEYNDIFKYFSNRKEGIKGYITVNSVTGEADLIKLDKGMKYMDSAIFNEDLNRKLRFKYPTKIFGEKSFEIDDKGNPYWIIPVLKYYGVEIRKEIKELIIFNPVSGKSELYDIKDVPTWVDHVYSASLIIEQINDWGRYRKGFINSIIGQKNVVATTEGYNYTVMNDDVYLYTGVTSAVADESNIGFILTNMRTKETNYYAVPGAEEYSAMSSAEGQVQQMNYTSTFPLLINLNGKPTYFVSLKDNAGLVKMYGLVDVTNYQKVVVVDSSLGIEELINKYLSGEKVNSKELTYKEIVIKEITDVVINGNTYYYISDTIDNRYRISIQNSNQLPFIKNGDKINIGYQKESSLTEIKDIK